MPKLPKYLDIAGLRIKVEKPPKLFHDDRGHVWGQWTPLSQSILIDGTIPTPQKEAEILIHEILHALFAHFEMKADDDREEEVVTKLARGLLMVFQANPKLLAYLKEVSQ